MSEVSKDELSKNPFAAFDFSYEEALEADERLKTRNPKRDARICACGHPISRHTNVSGIVYCKPNRMECPCKKIRAVLEASDTRPFLRRTEGAGKLHALGRGLVACLEKEINVKWIIELKCDKCAKEGPLSPVPVSQRGNAMNEPTGYDVLLCAACREEIG